MAKKRTQIHYVPSTHWDREWYLPFQGFRYKLVKVVDRLLEILEADPEYRYFVFDGQTVALDDYLEIMPENRPRLEALIRDGRILIGPWYTMPDERILSGESLIRNLMRGYADARGWGVEPMRYGYVCDIFGHIAQMPQIFAGMGIPHAFLWRGANDATHPSLFRWRAPDGSEVVVWRPSDDGAYSSGKPIWEAANQPKPGTKKWKEGVLEAARHMRKLEGSRSDVPVELWLDGQDHQIPSQHIPRALEVARKEMPDAEVIFSNLPAFAEAVEPYRADLPTFDGELIDPARDDSRWLAVIPHCLSSHYPMKQANDQCQTLLESWAEPYLAWATHNGQAPTSNFLDHAWQYLLQNHPHDSICGCSIDQVHKDTEYRYDQSAIIAAHVLKECQDNLMETEEGEPGELTLSLFSAHPARRKRVVTLEFDYPHGLPTRGMYGFPDDPIPCFDILDASGKKVDYQLHSYVREAGSQQPRLAVDGGLRAYYTIRASAETTLDGIGIKSFRIVPRKKAYRSMASQLIGPAEAENEHLVLAVQDSGAITIRDKQTDAIYTDLCIFEDTADVGDGWYHVRPVDNQTFLSTGFPTGISVLTDGAYTTTFRIEKTMLLPSSYSWMERRRSAERTPVRLLLDVTLRKGARQVECHLTVENAVKDHRIRVLFPTHVPGRDWFAGQPFTVVRRRRGVDTLTFDWQEAEVEEKSFVGMAGVNAAKSGLAILGGSGLHEIAVADDDAATVALTLMRGFKLNVQHPELVVPAPMDARSQLLGTMDFDWAIAPLSGKPDSRALWSQTREFQSGQRVRAHRGKAQDATFLKIRSGAVQLSTLKIAQDRDGVILRLFNPADTVAKDVLEFATPFESAVEVDHAEEPIPGARKIKGGRRLNLSLPKQKIRTYRLHFPQSD